MRNNIFGHEIERAVSSLFMSLEHVWRIPIKLFEPCNTSIKLNRFKAAFYWTNLIKCSFFKYLNSSLHIVNNKHSARYRRRSGCMKSYPSLNKWSFKWKDLISTISVASKVLLVTAAIWVEWIMISHWLNNSLITK